MDIKFNIDFDDKVSAKLKSIIKIAKQLEGVFDNINKKTANLNRNIKPIRVKVDTTEIDRAERRIRNLGGGSGSGGGKGGSIAGGVFKGAFFADMASKALSAAKDVAMDSIKAAMDNAMISKSFEVLTGSAGAGKQMTADLRHLKETTIMGSSVYKNAQTLMGFGVGQSEIIKDLKQIGDIAMGDQDRMQSLTLAFAQTRAAGKLMGQDLLQYINAGFNPLKVMADKWQEMGFKSKKTMGQLKEDMSDGKISSEMVAKAFELATSKGGMFYGMMDKIAETSAGKWKNLQGKWAGAQIDIGNALMPLANKFLDAGLAALKFMHISTSATDKIREEKTEVNYLVSSILGLEKGNKMRDYYIDELTKKYPDLLKGIDLEKDGIDKLTNALAKYNTQADKKLKYSMDDARQAYLKDKRDDAAQTGGKILDKLARAEAEPNSLFTKIPMWAFGDDYWTTGEGSRQNASKYFGTADDFDSEYKKGENTTKMNAADNLQNEAKEAMGLNKVDAEKRFGKNFQKIQKEIGQVLPNLIAKEMVSMTNIAGIPGTNMFGSSKVNEDAKRKLELLLSRTGAFDNDVPSPTTLNSKDHKVTGNNKQFIINIHGGLIAKVENHYDTTNSNETAKDIERAIIDGILNGLNALPGYIQ